MLGFHRLSYDVHRFWFFPALFFLKYWLVGLFLFAEWFLPLQPSTSRKYFNPPFLNLAWLKHEWQEEAKSLPQERLLRSEDQQIHQRKSCLRYCLSNLAPLQRAAWELFTFRGTRKMLYHGVGAVRGTGWLSKCYSPTACSSVMQK